MSTPIIATFKDEMKSKITRKDVLQAASEKGIHVLEALSMMQAVAANMKDENILAQLCEIKSEILFGDK